MPGKSIEERVAELARPPRMTPAQACAERVALARPSTVEAPATRKARGAVALATYARSKTRDGEEIIDRLLEIARDDAVNTPEAKRVRLNAMKTLLDRMFGKPVNFEVKIDGTATLDSPRPLKGYSSEQLAKLRTILNQPELADNVVIDVMSDVVAVEPVE